MCSSLIGLVQKISLLNYIFIYIHFKSNRAVDADSGPNAVLRYSLIGGNNQGHFAIDSLTGDVTVVQPLDYEIVRNYRLVVRAQGKIRCLVIEKSAILYILICY